MQLYVSTLACSLASRIVCYETEADVRFIDVDPKTKRTSDGRDHHTVHPLGMVPALELAPNDVLVENTAILQYLGQRAPERGLVPSEPRAGAALRQWLSFISTELHKAVFAPFFDDEASPEVKRYALALAPARLAILEAHLAKSAFLLTRYSVADAYLFAVLNWFAVTPIALRSYPAVSAYHARLLERPAIARAFGEERARYVAESRR